MMPANASIRILFVDTERVWRGGQEQLFGLMKGLKARGHQVWLASPRRAPLSRKAAELGIRVLPFRQRSEISLLAFWRLRRLLEKIPAEIVHFNTPAAILAGGLAARLARVPVRVASRRVNFPLRSIFSRFKYNRMLELTVTVSVSIRQTLVQSGVDPSRVAVVYEGVDLAWIDRQPVPPIETGYGGPVVGTVAHLSPEKGHPSILEAAARLRSRWPQSRYLFVGDGVLLGALQQMAARLGVADQVYFTGFRADSEALMKRFDIFCLPSLSEGLSSAILAAMASRLPVVATEVGGIPELVVDGETGILVPPNSPDRLAASLDRLFRDRPTRKALGEAGRRRVELFFTVVKKLDETEKLYRTLLAEIAPRKAHRLV